MSRAFRPGSESASSSTRSTAHEATDPRFDGRCSVPVLWDKAVGRIVDNESGDLPRMLDTAIRPAGDDGLEPAPRALGDEVNALNEHLDERVNDAVCKAGFATSQAVHEEEVRTPFGALSEYEHLWRYLRDLFQQPGIAGTVRFDEIRAHPSIDPTGLMALQAPGRRPRGSRSAEPLSGSLDIVAHLQERYRMRRGTDRARTGRRAGSRARRRPAEIRAGRSCVREWTPVSRPRCTA